MVFNKVLSYLKKAFNNNNEIDAFLSSPNEDLPTSDADMPSINNSKK